MPRRIMRRMNRSGTLLVGFTLSLATAIAAEAATVEWKGTLSLNIGPLPPLTHHGTGVATVNGSGGLGHLSSIRLQGGLTYTGGNNVPEVFPVTDPDLATVSSLRVTGVRLGTFTLTGISGGPPLGSKNTGLLPGRMKICLFLANCDNAITLPFGTPSGNMGVGVGGIVTAIKGSLVVSVFGAPWTIGVTTITVTTETPNGGISTYTKTLQGWVHGPVSLTSSTAAVSGVIQMVTPVVINSSACSPSTDAVQYKLGWAEVRLRFIPEPDMLLILGANLLLLVAIGRRRMKP